MIERGDLLDGDLLARGLVEGRTVRAVSVRGVQEFGRIELTIPLHMRLLQSHLECRTDQTH